MEKKTERYKIKAGKLLKFIEIFNSCKTGFDIFKSVQQVTQEAGYDWFAVIDIPVSDLAKPLRERIFLTNWRAELVEYLSDRNRLFETRFAKDVWKTAIPLSLDFTNRPRNSRQKEIYNGFLEYGQQTMIVLPMHGLTRFNGFMTVSGSRDLPAPAELMQLAYVSLFVHQAINRTLIENNVTSNMPSKRQLEIIGLLADGKSIDEIGLVLGLTTSTINYHLQNARAILNCKTKCQLIAETCKRRLIA